MTWNSGTISIPTSQYVVVGESVYTQGYYNFNDEINIFTIGFVLQADAEINVASLGHEEFNDNINIVSKSANVVSDYVNIFSNGNENINIVSRGANYFFDEFNIFSIGNEEISITSSGYEDINIFSIGSEEFSIVSSGYEEIPLFTSGFAHLTIAATGGNPEIISGLLTGSINIFTNGPEDISSVYFSDELSISTEGRDPYTVEGTLSIYTPNAPIEISGTITIIVNPEHRITKTDNIDIYSLGSISENVKGAVGQDIVTFCTGFYSDDVYEQETLLTGIEVDLMTIFSSGI